MDLSIFSTSEAWISLVTLIFLEIVLGVDNLVFIILTTNRLPQNLQPLGRKLGLGGALIMRILFLCFASFLVHLTDPLFTLDLGFTDLSMSVRELVLFVGGAYLIYKGIIELRSMLKLSEERAEQSHTLKILHQIGLPQAIVTIMIMDIVFSIDSVITAVGLAKHLIIMIIAVMLAVILMMVFINAVSNFINKHPEMKILALTFITTIGVLLIFDSLGFRTGFEILGLAAEKAMVYFAMIFSVIITFIQMAYRKNLESWQKEITEDPAGEEYPKDPTSIKLTEDPAGDQSTPDDHL